MPDQIDLSVEEEKVLDSVWRKILDGYDTQQKDKSKSIILKGKGQPCKQGETAARSHCIPNTEQSVGSKPNSGKREGNTRLLPSNIPTRNEGESDKQYAKRVIDKLPTPKSLPDNPSLYFNTDKADATIPISKLRFTKTDEENIQGGSNAPARMAAAAEGILGKRDPIVVRENSEGDYDVVDGNDTYTAARNLGWDKLPVVFDKVNTPSPEHKSQQVLSTLPKLLSTEMKLPPRQETGFSTKDQVYTAATKAEDSYKILLDLGKGLSKAIGAKSAFPTSPQEMVSVVEGMQNDPSPYLIIAPLKGEKRASEKVMSDYGGSWGKITDILRATVAVNKLDEIPKTIESLKAEMSKRGWKFNQAPKLKMVNPTPEGYRDINLILKNKETGMVAELQINTKPMLYAKEVKGHKIYEEQRTILAKISTENREATPEEKQRIDQLTQESKEVYADAWKQSIS